jgi:hypothetical protein
VEAHARKLRRDAVHAAVLAGRRQEEVAEEDGAVRGTPKRLDRGEGTIPVCERSSGGTVHAQVGLVLLEVGREGVFEDRPPWDLVGICGGRRRRRRRGHQRFWNSGVHAYALYYAFALICQFFFVFYCLELWGNGK